MAASMALRCLLRRLPSPAVPGVSPAAAAASRSTATQSRQLHGGPRTIAARMMQDGKGARMLREELKDYKTYRRRRAEHEAALASRNKSHNARVFAIGGVAISTLAVIGVLEARLRAKLSRGGDAQVYTTSH